MQKLKPRQARLSSREGEPEIVKRGPRFSLDCAGSAEDGDPTRRRRFAAVRQQRLDEIFGLAI